MLDGARIFHVNVNCSDLAASRAFYVDRCGLTEGVRTTPDGVQSGTAFGLDHARWDAWILVGADGFDGGAVDLLEWQDPRPAGAATTPGAPGFTAVRIAVGDGMAGATTRDPDGVPVELVRGSRSRAHRRRARLRRSRPVTRLLPRARLPRRRHGSDPGRRGGARPVGGRSRPPRARPGRHGHDEPRTARPANTVGIWRAALLSATSTPRWSGSAVPASRCCPTRRRWRWGRGSRTCGSSAFEVPTTR